MPSKITGNSLFNNIWCYLFIACFDWKIGVFKLIVVRVYYILKFIQSFMSLERTSNFALKIPRLELENTIAMLGFSTFSLSKWDIFCKKKILWEKKCRKKIVLFEYFWARIWKNYIVIFEISTLEFV